MRKIFQWQVLLFLAIVAVLAYMTLWIRQGVQMPGHSYTGALDPLDHFASRLRDNLKSHVEMLAGTIGERNLAHYDKLNQAADYIRQVLEAQEYQVSEDAYNVGGKKLRILYAVLEGSGHRTEPFVIGAHYDSVSNSPGANDNATGVAAVLELSRILKANLPARPVMFVFFPNEEPPYFQKNQMGSLVFARGFHKGIERFHGMMSLETMGYYSDQPGSQKYPPLVGSLYSDTGNFIAFAGDTKSQEMVKAAVAEFRLKTHFPAEGGSLPASVQGVGWSDHWSFWQVGVPAIMVTDTAVYRYPYYHKAEDTPEKLDYDRMARVVLGLRRVALKLAE